MSPDAPSCSRQRGCLPIRNRTIQAEDLAAGVLTPGPAGPAGAPGAPGEKGDRGEEGPAGPTEGGSSDTLNDWWGEPPANPDGGGYDHEEFTTTRAGRVFVSRTINELFMNCTSSGRWSIWLVVDGKPVPGTRTTTLESGQVLRGTVVQGVTASVLDAGEHTAHVAYDCSTSFSGSGSSGSGALTYIVLG